MKYPVQTCLFFGHTPAHQPIQYANQMYIDTGAVFCGRLTLVQIQGGDHA